MRLKSLFSVASLESFGGFDRAEISAMGALIEYLDITQKGQLPRLQWPVKESTQRVMQIDAATRRNLEITQSIQGGGRAGSLLATVDRTVTAGGGRLLERQISSPSMNVRLINKRLDCIQHMLDHPKRWVRSFVKACNALVICSPPDSTRFVSVLSHKG